MHHASRYTPHRPTAFRSPHLDRRSALLLLAIVVLAAFAGFVAFGLLGVIVAGGSMLLLSSSALALPSAWVMHLHGARPLSPWEKPGLQRLVVRLAAAAGIEAPALYLLPSAEPNALAAGGPAGDGAIAVTPGLLRTLDGRELAGVLAHEVTHLRRNDIALNQLASVATHTVATTLRLGLWLTFFGMLLFGHASFARLAQLFLLSLLLPPALMLLASALSRARELSADAEAARLTGDPLGLASALARIDKVSRWWTRLLLVRSDVPPALRTHPSTGERVERLRELAQRMRRRR